MARPSFRFPGANSLLVAALLVVLPTLGAQQAASQDPAGPTWQTPSWDDLGARRVCVSCIASFRVSPDGRFLYGTRWEEGQASILLRVNTAPGHGADRRTGSDVVLRALGRGRSFGQPIVSPDGTRLAFSSMTVPATIEMLEGWVPEWQVWIVDAETGADLQVLRVEAGPQNPLAWDLDGQGLFLDTPEGLVSVSLADETRRVLVPRAEGVYPKVSPDRRSVSYVAPDPGGAGYYHVAALDGSWRGPVAEAWPGGAFFWAPDGTALLYLSFQRDRPELWGVELSEGRAVGPPRPLLTLSRDAANTEEWVHSPIGITADGILFLHRVGDRSDVYTVEIDPETLELKGEPWSVFGGEGRLKAGGTISPDGTLLAFVTTPPHPVRPGVLAGVGRILGIRDLTTGMDRFPTLQPEVFGGSPLHDTPDWSPDGRYLLFESRTGRGESLYLLDVVSGEGRWLVERTPGETIGAFGWLPDGHTVVYGRGSPTETGVMLSVRRHDIATGLERELWQGPVEDFGEADMDGLRYSLPLSHLSPDGRYVTLHWEELDIPPRHPSASPYSALSILDLDTGEIRELYRDTDASCDPSRPSVFPSHQWSRSGREILVASCVNVPGAWGVNEPSREHTLFAIPVDGGAWRMLGRMFIEPGGWAALPHNTRSGGPRWFSLHPDSDALTFTGGGFVNEIWMVPDFGRILERWKQAR